MLETYQWTHLSCGCCPAGKLRYANNSNYKNDVMIRKEVSLGVDVSASAGVLLLNERDCNASKNVMMFVVIRRTSTKV